MTRLSIEITLEQHRAIKASAALEDMAMKDFVLHRLFHSPGIKIASDKPKKAKKAMAVKQAEVKGYDAGHPDCPLCQKYAKNGRYNARTERAISASLKEKNGKRYRSADELFKDLGLR